MSGIIFRDRKNHAQFDVMCRLVDAVRNPAGDGRELCGDSSSYIVGDTVHVCFGGQRILILHVLENCPLDFEFQNESDLLQIPCVVVSRNHSVSNLRHGVFAELTPMSFTLEANSGYWEDVLSWVMFGVKPEWVSSDTDAPL